MSCDFQNLCLNDLPELPSLVLQKRSDGLAVGHDSLLLARTLKLITGQRLLDLGCGQGVIALMLAAREKIQITGLELFDELLTIAKENQTANQHLLRGDVQWVCRDLRDRLSDDLTNSFDVVVMNAPYFAVGQGRIPPDPLRAAARFETQGTIGDWAQAANRLLRPGGMVHLVCRPDRLQQWQDILEEKKFTIHRVSSVRADENQSQPTWNLIEAKLNNG